MASSVKICKSIRKVPTCAVCRNHGLKIPVRGHKAFCRFRECGCKECAIIINSRKASCEKIRLRRQQALQDEKKGEKEMVNNSRKENIDMKHVHTEPTVAQYLPNHPPTFLGPCHQPRFEYLYSPQPQNFNPRFYSHNRMNEQAACGSAFVSPTLIDFSYSAPLVDNAATTTSAN